MDSKISALPAAASVSADDLLVIVDDPGGVATTKKITVANFSTSNGNVQGPASATDNAIARFDGTTGKLIQNSSVIVLDSGDVGVGLSAPVSRLGIQGASAVAGTGTLSSAGQIVTGVGTAFTTQLHIGDLITAAGQTAYVLAIANDTSFTTSGEGSFSPALSGDTFTYKQPITNFVDSAGTQRGIMGADGQFTLAHTTGQSLVLRDTATSSHVIGGSHIEFEVADGTTLGWIGKASSSADLLQFVAATGYLRFGTLTDKHIEWYTNGVVRMTVDATGDLVLTQGVSTSGSPVGFSFVGAAHTTLAASTEASDVYYGLSRTVQFATGALASQRAFVIDAPTYSFVGASTIEVAATVNIVNSPQAGTNAIIDNGVTLMVGDVITGSNSPATGTGGGIFAVVPGITNGIGAVSSRVGFGIFGADDIHLGNQTATLSELYGVSISELGVESTTNTRTVTTSALLHVGAGINNNGNVVFTNDPLSILADGDVRIDGDLIRAGSTSGLLTFAVPATITSHTLSWPSAQGAASTVLRNDGAGNLSWAAGVTGAGASTDNAIARFDGTSGNVIQNSGVTISDLNNVVINQTASTSGSPTGLTFIGGAHTNLAAGTEARDIYFDLSRTVQFASGALDTQIAFYVDAPTYAFTGASTLSTAATFQVDGVPTAGANATITEAYAAAFTAGSSYADFTSTVGISPPGIQNGIGAVSEIAALSIFGDSIGLGNQTATLTDLFGVRIGQSDFTSTTNVRTVTRAAALYIEGPPIASTNVTFTDGAGYSIIVDDGVSRFDGRIVQSQGVDTGSSGEITFPLAGNVFEITGTTTINSLTVSNLWQNGGIVTMLFSDALTVTHNAAHGAGAAEILLAGAANFSATAGDTLTLCLSEIGGVQAWREIARTVI